MLGSDKSWCVIRDFNDILWPSKKEGGDHQLRYLIEGFRAALEFCQLEDLGYEGPCFTWTNCREASLIRERLDRDVYSCS